MLSAREGRGGDRCVSGISEKLHLGRVNFSKLDQAKAQRVGGDDDAAGDSTQMCAV